MASISQTWNNSTPAGSDAVSAGDDRIRESKAAVRERAQNAGLYWPDVSADADSGVLFISPDAKVANEVNIFGKTGGNVPDTAKKLFSLTPTALALHADLTVNAAGTLQQAGSGVLAKNGTKRTVVLVTKGAADTASAHSHIGDGLMYVPMFNSGQVALTGVIREFAVLRQSISPTNGTTFDLKRAVTAAWSSNEITTLTLTSVLSGVLTLGTSKYGIRTAGVASFTGGVAFPTVAGGDILQVTTTANPGTNFFVAAAVVIDFDWPA